MGKQRAAVASDTGVVLHNIVYKCKCKDTLQFTHHQGRHIPYCLVRFISIITVKHVLFLQFPYLEFRRVSSAACWHHTPLAAWSERDRRCRRVGVLYGVVPALVVRLPGGHGRRIPGGLDQRSDKNDKGTHQMFDRSLSRPKRFSECCCFDTKVGTSPPRRVNCEGG